MDNKQNSDGDRITENITNKTGSQGTSTNKIYTERQASNLPRKKINPAAFVSSDDSDSSEYSDISASGNIPVSDMESDSYKEDMSEDNQDYNYSMDDSYSDRKPDEPGNSPYRGNTDVYDEPRVLAKQTSNGNRRAKKKNSARLPIVLMLTTLIFTVAICLSILIIAVGRDMLAIGKDDSIKMVTIEEGVDVSDVAKLLNEEGIIDIPKAFEIVVKLNDVDGVFIPGQYELSPSDAYETIIRKLTSEESYDAGESVSVTFLEGESIYDAAKTLEENEVCSAERFIYYFNAGGYGFEFEKKLPTSSTSKFYKMEGYLFPDTYTFYVGSDPESVCMKIYQNFENKMTDKYYEQMQKKGMTLDEVITLASIVQAEAANVESMKNVASVFENRLAHPDEFPKLQSDPTTYYVEEIIKPNIQVPSTAMFDAYDTYKGHGLPPGAIGNPGIQAIEAVLYPAKTNYYYFAADIDTREVYYAETLDEHEHNLAIINGEISEDNEYYEDEYADYEDENYE